MDSKNRGSFSSKLGFVLSAAGASVGLGNIWRFPYLAARYGGGAFLFVYIILALTFGYTMIIAETSIGRSCRKSPVGAFDYYGKNSFMKAGGWLNAIIPVLIVPYYSVVGGWVCKYLYEFICGDMNQLVADNYFSDFISGGWQAELWFVIFIAFVLGVIWLGVNNGIERVSGIMMPVLVVLALIISIYTITRPGAMEGVKYLLVPDFSRFSWKTVVAAMGQMFYSLSIAMGILITFGSYMKKDTSIDHSTIQVEIFDTAIALLGGLMIIPAVFAFSAASCCALLLLIIPSVSLSSVAVSWSIVSWLNPIVCAAAMRSSFISFSFSFAWSTLLLFSDTTLFAASRLSFASVC